jgi:UDP-N-acetylmuramoylalanine--D-glutamate ligase
VLLAVEELWRSLPHDVTNALAAAATARAGAPPDGGPGTCGASGGSPPGAAGGRVDGVRFYDDSKATDPHATVAAVSAASTSVVLIAGGRNKGLDLGAGRSVARLRAVVAIGEAAPTSRRPSPAVRPVGPPRPWTRPWHRRRGWPARATSCCCRPGCASFDWYGSYAERGDDFARAVVADAIGSAP